MTLRRRGKVTEPVALKVLVLFVAKCLGVRE